MEKFSYNSFVRMFGVSLVLLFCVACGPPRFTATASDGGESESDSESDATTREEPANPSTSSNADTSTSETDTSDSDTNETNLSFVPVSEMGGCECDPFAQDCPDGEKCVPYASTGDSWDANKCVPVTGDQATDEPCVYGSVIEATDDCDATGMCWDVMDVDGEWVGVCTAFCTGTADMPECPEGSQCLYGNGPIYLCIYTCDPLVQDCNEGLACYWANNDFNCIFTTQDIPVGEPCGFINDCALGNNCISADSLPSCAGSACCSPFCDLELGDQPCDVLPGTACVPFFEQNMAPPGYENVGVCVLPP